MQVKLKQFEKNEVEILHYIEYHCTAIIEFTNKTQFTPKFLFDIKNGWIAQNNASFTYIIMKTFYIRMWTMDNKWHPWDAFWRRRSIPLNFYFILFNLVSLFSFRLTMWYFMSKEGNKGIFRRVKKVFLSPCWKYIVKHLCLFSSSKEVIGMNKLGKK